MNGPSSSAKAKQVVSPSDSPSEEQGMISTDSDEPALVRASAGSKRTRESSKKIVAKKPKKVKNKKPKEMPKRPLSAYNIFFKEERIRWLEEKKKGGSDQDTDQSTFLAMGVAIGNRWKALTPEQRRKYETAAEDDTARYRKEMEDYNDRLIRETRIGRASLDGRIDKMVEEPSSVLPPEQNTDITRATLCAGTLSLNENASSSQASSLDHLAEQAVHQLLSSQQHPQQNIVQDHLLQQLLQSGLAGSLLQSLVSPHQETPPLPQPIQQQPDIITQLLTSLQQQNHHEQVRPSASVLQMLQQIQQYQAELNQVETAIQSIRASNGNLNSLLQLLQSPLLQLQQAQQQQFQQAQQQQQLQQQQQQINNLNAAPLNQLLQLLIQQNNPLFR